MSVIKKIILSSIILIGMFPFNKIEDDANISAVSIKDTHVVEQLLQKQLDCRPSSEIMFYVETDLIQKSRGFSTIKANIFILDKATGNTNLLATQNILAASYEDAVFHHNHLNNESEKVVLPNGDEIIGDKNTITPFNFNDLIAYEGIYSSYLKSSKALINSKVKR